MRWTVIIIRDVDRILAARPDLMSSLLEDAMHARDGGWTSRDAGVQRAVAPSLVVSSSHGNHRSNETGARSLARCRRGQLRLLLILDDFLLHDAHTQVPMYSLYFVRVLCNSIRDVGNSHKRPASTSNILC